MGMILTITLQKNPSLREEYSVAKTAEIKTELHDLRCPCTSPLSSSYGSTQLFCRQLLMKIHFLTLAVRSKVETQKVHFVPHARIVQKHKILRF